MKYLHNFESYNEEVCEMGGMPPKNLDDVK